MGTICDYERVKQWRDLREVERKLDALEEMILAQDDLEKRAMFSSRRYALRLACANLKERLRNDPDGEVMQ